MATQVKTLEDARAALRGERVEGTVSTPTSIKFNRFLKFILLEHKPLLACFGFVTSQKGLVSVKINLRKRLILIDIGAEVHAPQTP